MNRVVALAALLLGVSGSLAGEFNKKLKIGDAAPAWKDLPGTDGKKHSLADLKDKDVVVVVFTCNSCPVAEVYEERIVEFAKRHAGNGERTGFVAINVNTVREDRLDKMQEKAKKAGFNFPYLYDESQQIARDFGATYTPEFFVLNKDRKIVYMGAMDDKTNPNEAKVNYLEAAVEATLKGLKVEKVETLARGCFIRWAKKRASDD